MLDITSTGAAYAMLGSQNIWDVARICHELLDAAGVPHALVGGVAVCLHGYRRNTVDVDVLGALLGEAKPEFLKNKVVKPRP